MKRIIICIMAILMVFVLASCGKDTSPKTVATDRVFLTLDSNPTTGCTWMVTMDESGVAEYIGSKYVQDEAPASQSGEQIAGSGGKETFEFRCLKEGTANVVLKYGHAWTEDEIYDVKNARITVSSNLTGTIELY